MPSRPQALLFDLGGVLLDVRSAGTLQAWAPHSALPLDELRARYAADGAGRRYERGELSGTEYFAHIARTLELDAPVEDIERGWNAIFFGEVEPTLTLVERARRQLPCFGFSNTNASHQATYTERYPRLVAAFDRIFTSHELGLRKPERAAYDRVCALVDAPAPTILFFDDLAENVEAARAAGLQAVWVRSAEDVAAALAPWGLGRA